MRRCSGGSSVEGSRRVASRPRVKRGAIFDPARASPSPASRSRHPDPARAPQPVADLRIEPARGSNPAFAARPPGRGATTGAPPRSLRCPRSERGSQRARAPTPRARRAPTRSPPTPRTPTPRGGEHDIGLAHRLGHGAHPDIHATLDGRRVAVVDEDLVPAVLAAHGTAHGPCADESDLHLATSRAAPERGEAITRSGPRITPRNGREARPGKRPDPRSARRRGPDAHCPGPRRPPGRYQRTEARRVRAFTGPSSPPGDPARLASRPKVAAGASRHLIPVRRVRPAPSPTERAA